MQNKISIAIECLGLIGLIYGYARKNRNLMLASALVLWFGGSLNDFIRGFIAGYKGV
ncbi:hypothetical protein [Mesoterricola silvestris]|uniref:Uncharacterized protein n=1 Tax=Mesoterricola silvestris TaxID=2927979 RepID=A0AA48KBP4_9BACT|nr:hypothetical protein [Mesoterricola silvestris]BDU74527.1 hypothetical protein METEAL_37010 [Mesoterricola silvestris]